MESYNYENNNLNFMNPFSFVILDTNYIVKVVERNLDYIDIIKQKYTNATIVLPFEVIEEMINLYKQGVINRNEFRFAFSVLVKREPMVCFDEEDFKSFVALSRSYKKKDEKKKEDKNKDRESDEKLEIDVNKSDVDGETSKEEKVSNDDYGEIKGKGEDYGDYEKGKEESEFNSNDNGINEKGILRIKKVVLVGFSSVFKGFYDEKKNGKGLQNENNVVKVFVSKIIDFFSSFGKNRDYKDDYADYKIVRDAKLFLDFLIDKEKKISLENIRYNKRVAVATNDQKLKKLLKRKYITLIVFSVKKNVIKEI